MPCPELGRAAGEVLGLTEGLVLGRTLGAEGREALGDADGRDMPPPLEPPLDGRGDELEPRDPWYEDPWLDEPRELPPIEPPPLEPRDEEAEAPEEPRDPRCAKASAPEPRTRRPRPIQVARRVFMAG